MNHSLHLIQPSELQTTEKHKKEHNDININNNWSDVFLLAEKHQRLP